MTTSELEFGDFQTPRALADEVVKLLSLSNSPPSSVLEPTCGTGNFLSSAIDQFQEASHFIGMEINPRHIETAREKCRSTQSGGSLEISQVDFFQHDWSATIARLPAPILILGNPPWVTNSAQAVYNGTNLPEKSNLAQLSGFDAITGSSNFDISEWMLRKLIQSIHEREVTLAMLIKTSVARKILAFVAKEKIPILTANIYEIDSSRHFGVSVDACLFLVRFDSKLGHPLASYGVYKAMDELNCSNIYWDNNRFSSKASSDIGGGVLFKEPPQKWRSGVKHDASKIMELQKKGEKLLNGFGQEVLVEPDRLFPLFKGSEVAGSKDWRGRFLVVTQDKVGQETDSIQDNFPKLHGYLMDNASALDSRKSSIYKRNPRFSVFGVGDYTFKPWKIAIASLYKKLHFQLFAPLDGKPVVFDDTVYFIGFDEEQEARETLNLLSRDLYRSSLNSLIFWDEKRPVKAAVLNQVSWID